MTIIIILVSTGTFVLSRPVHWRMDRWPPSAAARQVCQSQSHPFSLNYCKTWWIRPHMAASAHVVWPSSPKNNNHACQFLASNNKHASMNILVLVLVLAHAHAHASIPWLLHDRMLQHWTTRRMQVVSCSVPSKRLILNLVVPVVVRVTCYYFILLKVFHCTGNREAGEDTLNFPCCLLLSFCIVGCGFSQFAELLAPRNILLLAGY